MPLKKGKSKKVISSNISELTKSKPGVARAKGIATLAKNRGISKAKAKNLQAQAIAFSKAKKKKPTHSQVAKSVKKTMGH